MHVRLLLNRGGCSDGAWRVIAPSLGERRGNARLQRRQRERGGGGSGTPALLRICNCVCVRVRVWQSSRRTYFWPIRRRGAGEARRREASAALGASGAAPDVFRPRGALPAGGTGTAGVVPRGSSLMQATTVPCGPDGKPRRTVDFALGAGVDGQAVDDVDAARRRVVIAPCPVATRGERYEPRTARSPGSCPSAPQPGAQGLFRPLPEEALLITSRRLRQRRAAHANRR